MKFTPRHEKDVVIAIYIPFIKLLLCIKRDQTKRLEVWSNLLKVVSATFLLICFVYSKEGIWETGRNVFISL